MKLYNPTQDVIEGRFSNFTYEFGPEVTKSVTDDCGKHLLSKCGSLGLVSIDYGEAEEQKYGSIAEYKKIKKEEGLKAYKEWLTHCMQQEQMFPRENQEKNGGEVELSNTKVPYFKNKIKEVENLLAGKMTLTTEPKKKGRPPKVNNVNETTATS